MHLPIGVGDHHDARHDLLTKITGKRPDRGETVLDPQLTDVLLLLCFHADLL